MIGLYQLKILVTEFVIHVYRTLWYVRYGLLECQKKKTKIFSGPSVL